MNKKGFTLIEVLAVVLIIGLIAALVFPSLINTIDTGKKASYDILINNIITASKSYYEECEYGNLSDKEKYGSYACKINNDKINITLGDLANTGFLTGTTDNSTKIKKVINPDTNKDISSCKIIITKTKTSKGKIDYVVTSDTTDSICPSTYKEVK